MSDRDLYGVTPEQADEIAAPDAIPSGAASRDVSATSFAPGRDAEHPYGVIYRGNYETLWDGTATAVRRHVMALAKTGIPVCLQSQNYAVVSKTGAIEPVQAAGLDPIVLDQVGPLRFTSIGKPFPIIRHAVVLHAEALRKLVLPRGIISQSDAQLLNMRSSVMRGTILYSVWERDRINEDLARHLRRLGACWVPCEQNRQMLVDAGVHNVEVMPHPYDPDDDVHKLARRPPWQQGEWRTYYSIGRWEPRKGYDKLLVAFFRAFAPHQKVVLTLKYTETQWKDYPSPAEAVHLALEDEGVKGNGWTAESIDQRLRMYEGRLPADQILELHYRNEIYVASSHGEAWCLPAFDALMAGNTLVYVPYGGVSDFRARGAVVVAPIGREDVPPSYGWDTGAQWASFEIDALAAALQRAEPLAVRREPNDFWINTFSPATVGRKMAESIIQVARRSSEGSPAADAAKAADAFEALL